MERNSKPKGFWVIVQIKWKEAPSIFHLGLTCMITQNTFEFLSKDGIKNWRFVANRPILHYLGNDMLSWLQWKTNGNSYAIYRMVPFAMTVNHLE